MAKSKAPGSSPTADSPDEGDPKIYSIQVARDDDGVTAWNEINSRDTKTDQLKAHAAEIAFQKLRDMADRTAAEYSRDARSGIDEALKTAMAIAQSIDAFGPILVPLERLINELANIDRGKRSKLFEARPPPHRPGMSVENGKFRATAAVYIESLIANKRSLNDAIAEAAVKLRLNRETLRNWRERIKSPEHRQYRPTEEHVFPTGKYFDELLSSYAAILGDPKTPNRLLKALRAIDPTKKPFRKK